MPKTASPTKRAERVKQVRRLRSRGLTLTEVAEELGLSRSYVCSISADPSGKQERLRKKSYSGTCLDCGGPTSGSNGKNNAPDRCAHCSPKYLQGKAVKKWTREVMIARGKEWYEKYGASPTSMDWNRTVARRRNIENPDHWPWCSSVFDEFGRWGTFLGECGLPLTRAPSQGGARHKTDELLLKRRIEFCEALVQDSVPMAHVARAFWRSWGYANEASLISTMFNKGIRALPGGQYRIGMRTLTAKEREQGRLIK